MAGVKPVETAPQNLNVQIKFKNKAKALSRQPRDYDELLSGIYK